MSPSSWRTHVAAVLFLALVAPLASAQSLERVQFLAEPMFDVDGLTIRLLGGSEWRLSRRSLVLGGEDVVIVIRSIDGGGRAARAAFAYIANDVIPATHIGGTYTVSEGWLSRVVQASDDGSVIQLADGSLLAVPEYDRFDTGWWLPPYPVLLTSSGLYLYNLDSGKRVWVNPVSQ